LVQISDYRYLKCHFDADVAQNWRKSSRSMTDGNCVEVAGPVGDFVGVRDSLYPEGTVLSFTQGARVAFVGVVRNGKFDRNR
jgi:Domain of unknown function (DUF397)